MPKPTEGEAALSPLQQLAEETRKEYDQTQRELKEIDVLIQQTSTEVDRLAQRNAQANNRLRQLEMTFDTVPRGDIQETYNGVMDAQKRLFMMRGQLEKLQSDQQHLQRYVSKLARFLEATQGVQGATSRSPAGEAAGQPPTVVRIIETQEQERQRLVRQLHDGPAQSLTNLILQAEICERLFDNDAARARAELGNLKTAVVSTFQKVREFMADLRPMMLDDLGLIPTLKRYVDTFSEKSGIPTTFSLTGAERRLAPHKEVTIFRVTQELLNNARQHARATRIQVNLDVDEDLVRAVVEDNGGGFNPKEVLAPGGSNKGIGLSTLRERIEMLGGQIQIDSSTGHGTRVSFEIPMGE
jgi:two-component system sensor histidine kinase DegS